MDDLVRPWLSASCRYNTIEALEASIVSLGYITSPGERKSFPEDPPTVEVSVAIRTDPGKQASRLVVDLV
jgi:hypothetical protein